MKSSITLIVFILFFISSFSQQKGPKVSAKQLNQIGKNAMEIQKINEVINSFNDVSASLNSKLANLNVEGLKDTLEMQGRYLDTIFQILEASNLKISITADSLSTTTYTIVSLIDETNEKFEDIENYAEQNFLYTLGGIALVALLSLILFIILFIKMGSHNKKSKAQFAEIKGKVDEELQGMKKSVEDELANTKRSLDGRIRITDSTLSRRMKESSEATEKQFAENKTSIDEQFTNVQNILKNDLDDIQKLLDKKITDTNKIVETHIASTKEIMDKLSDDKD